MLYLAIDHYIKANPIHFIQSAIGLPVLILVIPCISITEKSDEVLKTNIKQNEGRTLTDGLPERTHLKLYPDVTELFKFMSKRVKL